MGVWNFITSVVKGSPVSGAENKANFDAITDQALRKDNSLSELTPTATAARSAISAASLSANTFSGDQTVGKASPQVIINDTGSNTAASILFRTGGNNAYGIGKSSGANPSLNFNRYDNAGAFVDTPISVNYTTGALTLSQALPVGSGGTGQTSNGTAGQYVVSGGAGQPMTFTDPIDQTVFKMKNRIVNSDCSRMDAPVQLRSSTGSYGPVNFRQDYSKGAFTMSQGSLTYNGRTYATARCTCTTLPGTLGATDYYTGAITVIEGTLCYDFNNNAFVAAGVLNVSVAGNYVVCFRDAATDATVKGFAFVVAVAANTPTFFSKSIPATSLNIPKSSTVRCVVTIGAVTGTAYQTAAADVWYTGNQFSLASQTNWATAVGNFVEITLLHFEKGNKFTGFEIIAPQENDRMCDRYSQRVDTLISMVSLGRGAGADIYRASTALRSPMRSTPTTQSNLTTNNFIGSAGPNADQWTYVQSLIAFVEFTNINTVQVAGTPTNFFLISQHNTPTGLRTADAISLGANMYILLTAYL